MLNRIIREMEQEDDILRHSAVKRRRCPKWRLTPYVDNVNKYGDDWNLEVLAREIERNPDNHDPERFAPELKDYLARRKPADDSIRPKDDPDFCEYAKKSERFKRESFDETMKKIKGRERAYQREEKAIQEDEVEVNRKHREGELDYPKYQHELRKLESRRGVLIEGNYDLAELHARAGILIAELNGESREVLDQSLEHYKRAKKLLEEYSKYIKGIASCREEDKVSSDLVEIREGIEGVQDVRDDYYADLAV